MEIRGFPAVLAPAKEGGFVVSFPDVPEALTQGEDREDALARAVDALETALEMYVEEGRRLPKASAARRGQVLVRPPILARMKLAVYSAMLEQQIKKTELARRMGWHLMQVDRLLDLRHSTRVNDIEAALGSLNRAFDIDVECIDRSTPKGGRTVEA